MTEQTKEADVPSSNLTKKIGLIAGIVGALLVRFFFDPGDPIITNTAAVAVLMSVWWITEALPLGATALLPIVLFPALGVMDGKAVTKEYGHWVIFLFLGGFLISVAMERWKLHRRIALNILRVVGSKKKLILIGFMAGTAFLSMWISNTATTMMMVPIALAVVLKLGEDADNTPSTKDHHFGNALMLGTAYAASIGGMMTLVGTPPNVALVAQYETLFPEAQTISFGSWMVFAFPLCLLMLATVWTTLSYSIKSDSSSELQRQKIMEEVTKLPEISREELYVALVFAGVAISWIFRNSINLGFAEIPGWSSLFPQSGFINDGTVAIAFAVLLFILPSRDKGRILEVNAFSKIPWGIVLLFGGGFALAAGFKESGLSAYIGEQLASLGSLPLPLLIATICLIVTFLTEVTSNTATAQILLPILGALAIQLDIDPLLLMIPGALSCSCAFMLPVATPPNAIAFASGQVSLQKMMRFGILLNLIGVVLITLCSYLIPLILF